MKPLLLRDLAIVAVAALTVGACRDEGNKKVAVKPPPLLQPPPAPKVGARPPSADGIGEPLEIRFPARGLSLYGYITKPPTGNGPWPAILYSHGSEQAGGRKEVLRKYWASHGYVFFLPHRSGHGKSPGQYFQDKGGGDHSAAIKHFKEHAEEVADGVVYLKTLPYVNKNKVIVGGCSYGGIMTTLVSAKDLGLRAALDYAGGAMSWAHDQPLHALMKKAIDNIRIPIFFIQAENDWNTDPSKVLAAEATKMHKEHKIKIYPPYGTTHEEGHGGFCAHQTALWSNDVLQWLQKYNP